MNQFLAKRLGQVILILLACSVMGSSLAFAEMGAQASSKSKIDPKEIQKALTEAGFYKGTIDGVIGTKTKVAIRSFQRKQGLVADGVCGSKTWEKLKAYLEEATKTETVATPSTPVLEETVENGSMLQAESTSEPEADKIKQKLVP